jgi:6-phosphogluconolactonase (cycloisomerase 2 family)
MTMRVRGFLMLVAALAMMGLASCDHYTCGVTFGSSTCSPSGPGLGGGGTVISASTATSLVYFVNNGSVGAAGFAGTTFAPLSSYSSPSLPTNFTDNMAIVNKKFLYIPMGDTTIQGFSINRSTGALTPIPGNPVTVAGGVGTADGAWSDPLGRFLFVGSEGFADIWVFQIDATTGALTATAGSPFTTGLSSADIMTVDASGKFLYVGQGSVSSGVAGFSIDQSTGTSTSGALTPLAGSPFSLAVAQIHASPTGEFLLGVAEIQDAGIASQATDQHIYVYSIDPVTGVPDIVNGQTFATTMAPFDFAISPNGQFVYTVGTAVNTITPSPIEGFQMDVTTGALTTLTVSPFTSLLTPSQCEFDQGGTALVCVDSSGSQMTVLTASPSNGSLSHAADLGFAGTPFATTD